MPRVVNVYEAKTHLSRLPEDVSAGEEIILAKAGRPYARLVPIGTPADRPLGFVPGRLTEAFFEPLPKEELAAWE